MFNDIVNFMKTVIPPKLWADITETTWEVALLVLAIFSVTQIVKITLRYTPLAGKPTEMFLHFASITTAAGFAPFVVTGTIGDKALVGVISWLATYIIATYGMGFIKFRWPELWKAINFERRKPFRRMRPPNGVDRRESA